MPIIPIWHSPSPKQTTAHQREKQQLKCDKIDLGQDYLIWDSQETIQHPQKRDVSINTSGNTIFAYF